MNHIEAVFLGDGDQANTLLPPGSSNSGGSALLLPAYQAAPVLSARALRARHRVTASGLAQMNRRTGQEASMLAAPS